MKEKFGEAAVKAMAAESNHSVAQPSESDAAWCRRMRTERRAAPGRSWGRLSETEQAAWMARRCDRFFCRPNAMESRGTYTCVPLQ